MSAPYDADDDYSNQSSVGCCSRLFSRHRRQQRSTDPVAYERRVSDVSISPASFGSPQSPTAYPIMPESSFSIPSVETSTAPIHPIPAVGSIVPTTDPRTFCVEEPPPIRHETRQVLSPQQSTSPPEIGFEGQQPWRYPSSGLIGGGDGGTAIYTASSTERNISQPIEGDVPVDDIDNGQQSSIPNVGTDVDQQLTEAEAEASTEASAPSMPTSDGEETSRSAETTGYSEEPSNIDFEIGRILDRVEAGHHILVEDPDDSARIYIIGVFVERALADFEALTTQPDFQALTIVPHNVEPIHNGLPQYAKHLMPFTLERKVQVNAQGRAERTTNYPKCQLIVTATHVNNSSTSGRSDLEKGYYGVTVAHAFLTDSQTERLLDSEQYDESIRMEMLEETWNSQWSLRAHTANNRGLLQMVRPPFLDYREYFLNNDSFLQDIAVFQISEKQLREDGWRDTDAATGEEELFSFNNGLQTYKVGGLFPIESHEDIISLCGKKVLVAFAEGVLTAPPRQVPRHGVASEMQLGLHITFHIKPPHRMEEGHSGHMVYVVDKDEKTVYIAGMLTGYLDKFEEISGKTIYQAVVIGEGLQRLEQKFSTKIRNIQMLANHTARNLVNQLQDGPQIH